jgi:predicted Zn-dependent protease with MMP-like domain
VTYAVIIKHFARGMHDCRVDLYDWPEDKMAELAKHVESQLLGPFEVIAITTRVEEKNKQGGAND